MDSITVDQAQQAIRASNDAWAMLAQGMEAQRASQRERQQRASEMASEHAFITSRDAAQLAGQAKVAADQARLQAQLRDQEMEKEEQLREQGAEKAEDLKNKFEAQRQARLYGVPTKDKDGSDRSTDELTADTQKSAYGAARNLWGQLNVYQNQLKGLYSPNTDVGKYQSRAADALLSTPTEQAKLGPDLVARLKALNAQGKLGDIFASADHGPSSVNWFGLNPDPKRIRAFIDDVNQKSNDMMTADNNVKAMGAQLQAQAIKERIAPIAAEFGKHFAFLNPADQSKIVSGAAAPPNAGSALSPNASSGDVPTNGTDAAIQKLRQASGLPPAPPSAATPPPASAASPVASSASLPPPNTAFPRDERWKWDQAGQSAVEKATQIKQDINDLEGQKQALLKSISQGGEMRYYSYGPGAAPSPTWVKYSPAQIDGLKEQGQGIERQIAQKNTDLAQAQRDYRYATMQQLSPNPAPFGTPAPVTVPTNPTPGSPNVASSANLLQPQHISAIQSATGVQDANMTPEENQRAMQIATQQLGQDGVNSLLDRIRSGDPQAFQQMYAFRDMARSQMNGAALAQSVTNAVPDQTAPSPQPQQSDDNE